ncbi:hypothetical protein [Brevibacterium moorei]|uniref:hypothetical protein n=1 Tax=Brevibacterium moorei TaxID=2968457 RepID=UPI00211CF96D|nr:hypothetical protein [Brevibacterium sp. 68QC2CO]MCQ9384396.1 hypothetical protein [Brevibacterium sp. 68QC2CO]
MRIDPEHRRTLFRSPGTFLGATVARERGKASRITSTIWTFGYMFGVAVAAALDRYWQGGRFWNNLTIVLALAVGYAAAQLLAERITRDMLLQAREQGRWDMLTGCEDLTPTERRNHND